MLASSWYSTRVRRKHPHDGMAGRWANVFVAEKLAKFVLERLEKRKIITEMSCWEVWHTVAKGFKDVTISTRCCSFSAGSRSDLFSRTKSAHLQCENASPQRSGHRARVFYSSLHQLNPIFNPGLTHHFRCHSGTSPPPPLPFKA